MPEMVYLRIIFTFLIACFLGFLFSLHKNPEEILALNQHRKKPQSVTHNTTEKNHENEEICNHQYSSNSRPSMVKTISDEFFEMLKVLILGASIASFIQVVIPRNIILSIGSGPILSVLAMILFAVIVSVCSSVDAFIALSYVNTFTAGSLLAFLTFGPMIDLKSFVLYRTIFKWKTILLFTAIIFLCTTFLTIFVNLYWS